MGVGALLVSLVGVASAAVAAAWAAAAWQASRRPRVLCLMYHRVAPRPAWEGLRGTERVFTLPEDAFDAQLSWLRAHGYAFVDGSRLLRFARGESTLPHPSVLITIDDGCASVHGRMLPVLRRHGATAVLFVTTDPDSAIFRLGEGERRVTDAELRELADAGVEIGSHAVSHRPLSAMDDDEIRQELQDSKRTLERVLGRPVVQFAVPANWYDARVLRLARAAGYEAVYCSRPDTVRFRAGAFGIARLNVEGHLDTAGFARALSPAGVAQRRLVMALRALPKRVLGPGNWTRVRREVFRRVGGDWLSPSRMATAVALAVGAGLLATLGWLLARS